MGLDLVVRRETRLEGDAVDADERDVQVEALERLLGDGPDELVGLGACGPARDDELQVGADRELPRDVEGVGHDGDPVPIRDRTRDLRGGRPPGEADDRTVRHPRRGVRGDQLLLGLVPRGLVPERELVEDVVGHRAAVRP